MKMVDLAEHADIARMYPAIAAAAIEVGTPQIRNQATVLRHHHSPSMGVVLGLDAHIALTARLLAVPGVRYDTAFGGRSGVALSWCF